MPPTAQGDQILVSVTHSDNTTVATPAGYTEVATWAGPSSRMRLWRRTATGNETNVILSFSNLVSVKAAAVAVYRGVDPDDPIVATAAGASPADGVTIPSLDAASLGDRLVTFGGATHLIPGTNTWTTPEGMRVRGTTNSGTVTAIIAEQDLSAPGPTGTRTFGYTTNGSIIAAGIILRRPPTPERWHHHDQLGSTRALTDETGAKVGTATYDPYGAPTVTTGETARLGFAGEYSDPSTGLTYLRARWYDPDTGQFLTRDPAEALTREPYAYAGNDPVNRVDPMGLWDIPSFVPVIGGMCVDINDPDCESPRDGHSTDLSRGVVNFAGGVLQVNPITAFLPLDLEGHGVNTSSGSASAGRFSMAAFQAAFGWSNVPVAALNTGSGVTNAFSACLGINGAHCGGSAFASAVGFQSIYGNMFGLPFVSNFYNGLSNFMGAVPWGEGDC